MRRFLSSDEARIAQITEGEYATLCKCAQLRGELGRLRREITKARNLLLRHEHIAPPSKFERDALGILSAALAIPSPEKP